MTDSVTSDGLATFIEKKLGIVKLRYADYMSYVIELSVTCDF